VVTKEFIGSKKKNFTNFLKNQYLPSFVNSSSKLSTQNLSVIFGLKGGIILN